MISPEFTSKVKTGDLVEFKPWGMKYPTLGVVLNERYDDGVAGYGLVVVLDNRGELWNLYPEQVSRVEDDG
jgi:hypothetical protein